MPFDSGVVAFRRYTVVGQGPLQFEQAHLDAVMEHSIRPAEPSLPEEADYGWTGGRHVLDATITFENNVFAEALHVGLRIDTNRVPAEIKRAFQMLEDDAATGANPGGLISRVQKLETRRAVRRRLEQELRSGKYRRSRLYPVLWDLPSATVMATVHASAEPKLRELFERTFGLSLEPLSAGALARRLLEARGRRRDTEDVRPTAFVAGPEGPEQRPEYPWTARLSESRDYLGNEFLLWLWHATARAEGFLTVNGREIAVMFEKVLDLDCVYGATGRASLRSTGPAGMPEAFEALRTGKIPRKAGLTIESAGAQFTFTLAAETLAISGLKLPEVPEADTPRVHFEERVALLRQFGQVLDGLFGEFLRRRISAG
ncbi:MAG: hypothetical protein NZ561_02520, partial [Phycisphaerae bacterium]|nr:hypothetical protein [Phycisphaerae bacterium]